MRIITVVLLLHVFSGSAFAQNTFSVDQFDTYLARIQHSRDNQAAGLIAGVTLKERASASDVARWQAEFKGEKARRALTAVGDIAEFLAPPSSALVDAPTPSVAAQVEILKRTVSYIEQSLPRLPNLLAVRMTTRFDITTRKQLLDQEEASRLYQLNNWEPKYEALGTINGQTLFFGGEWQFVVTYRDGAEVSQSEAGGHHHPPPLGLETKGEFGPILTTVFGDALKGSIKWNHWEQGANGQLAVFDYDVPKGASHYAVENVVSGSADLPAYHGELAIDPGTGAIFRITVTAEGSESSAARESNIALEYGPEEIGGKTYICPLHGVAYTQPRLLDTKGNPLPGQQKEGPRYLNDATFTQYHLFRSEVRILTDDARH
jgi:hypothetical protein